MDREPWDDWVKTCGEPTVWTGFDWPEPVSNYVVLPNQRDIVRLGAQLDGLRVPLQKLLKHGRRSGADSDVLDRLCVEWAKLTDEWL